MAPGAVSLEKGTFLKEISAENELVLVKCDSASLGKSKAWNSRYSVQMKLKMEDSSTVNCKLFEMESSARKMRTFRVASPMKEKQSQEDENRSTDRREIKAEPSSTPFRIAKKDPFLQSAGSKQGNDFEMDILQEKMSDLKLKNMGGRVEVKPGKTESFDKEMQQSRPLLEDAAVVSFDSGPVFIRLHHYLFELGSLIRAAKGTVN